MKIARIDWFIVGGAVVAVVGSLLPWYGVSIDLLGITIAQSVNGWHLAFLGWLAALLCATAGAAVVWSAVPGPRQLPASRVASIAFAAGALSALIILVRMVVQPEIYGLRIGIFVSLAGAVCVAAGGYLKAKHPAV
jgi:hypothetical protein